METSKNYHEELNLASYEINIIYTVYIYIACLCCALELGYIPVIDYLHMNNCYMYYYRLLLNMVSYMDRVLRVFKFED